MIYPLLRKPAAMPLSVSNIARRVLSEERYRTHLKEQARTVADFLADAWRVMPAAPPEMFAGMVTLPLPIDDEATNETAQRMRLRLLRERQIEVPIHAINGRHWVRISAQVYNELSDYEKLARVFAR